MSNDKNQAQPHHRPPANAPLELPKGLPVLQLKFHTLVEIPGKLATTGLKSDIEQVNRHRWRISFLPQLRHFQLEYFPAGSTAAKGSYLVHEHHIEWWEPIP